MNGATPLLKKRWIPPGVMHHGIMNIPALFILIIVIAIIDQRNTGICFCKLVIVFVKVAIVVVFIVIGWKFVNGGNHTPYLIPADAPDALNRMAAV
jgi:APA family basic amino acid/polyamine antiporter